MFIKPIRYAHGLLTGVMCTFALVSGVLYKSLVFFRAPTSFPLLFEFRQMPFVLQPLHAFFHQGLSNIYLWPSLL